MFTKLDTQKKNAEVYSLVWNREWAPYNAEDRPRSNKKRWSDEDSIRLVELAGTKMTTREIAEYFEGRTVHSIQMRLAQIGRAILDGGNKYQ